jgi:iron complex outermembrane receptor protein
MLFFSGVGQTCDIEFKGTLRDEDNSEALSYAYIVLSPGNYTAQGDNEGKFIFKNLCAGTYTMRVSHLGCKDTLLIIALKASKSQRFTLPHSHQALKDVDIVTKHQDARQTQNVQVLDRKEMDKVMGQSLGEQLKQLNGVTSINTGPTISKPMLNGMQGYRILLLNNGVRQEGQQWGFEHAPEIDPFAAGSISVLRGAASVRYGSDAIGGVVLVNPQELPDSTELTGDVQLSGFTNGRGGAASAMLQGHFEKMKFFRWRVQGSIKESGSIKTPNYYLNNTGANERNYSLLMDYHSKVGSIAFYYAHFGSKIGIFSGSHIGNLSDLYAAFNSSKPQDSLATFSYEIGRPYQKISHDLAKLDVDIHTGKRSRVKVMYAWQFNHRQEYDKHLPRNEALAALNLPASDYRLATQTGELVWEHDYIRHFRGQFGVQGMYQENRYSQKFFVPNYNASSVGIFAIERYIYNALEIEAGVRADYKSLDAYYYAGNVLQTPSRTFQNISYQLGSNYRLSRNHLLSVNIGSGWRAPSAVELFSNGLHHGIGAIERGDAGLKKEQANSIVASYTAKYGRFNLQSALYHYEFGNYIYYYPSNSPELTIRGAFPVFYYAQCKARLSGADAQVVVMIRRYLHIRAKAMVIRGFNKDRNEPLIYLPSDRIELGVKYGIGESYGKTLYSFYIEPLITAVAKQTRVPADVDFVPPPKGYVLLGLQAGCELNIKNHLYYVSLSASNMTNTVYRDYLDRFRYYNDAAASNYRLNIRIPFNIIKKKFIPYEALIEVITSN